VDLLLITWIVAYGFPCLFAMRMFRQLVGDAARGTG
jgi:hypothetical protein